MFSPKKILCICDNIYVNYFEKAENFVNITSSSSDQFDLLVSPAITTLGS